MNGDPHPASSPRSSGRFVLWLALGLALVLVIYCLTYFSLRFYRHLDGVSLVAYGEKCIHLYGPPEKRASFINSVHALPRETPFGSLTGIYEDQGKTWFNFTLLFVPIEMLECRLRDGI